MANKDRRFCICGSFLLRTDTHNHNTKVHTGYVCPKCQTVYNVDLVPMIPVSSIIELTPGLEKVDPQEAYKTILEIIRDPGKYYSSNDNLGKIAMAPDDPILKLQKKLSKNFDQFCRKNE